MILINHTDLSSEALSGIAVNYVDVMQGSDYDESPYNERVERSIQAIKDGVLSIVFSEVHEEIRVVNTRELKIGKTALA
ncbi:conserved hypothetical protein [Vibrio chagasii]|nr:conserved hypothetical protein [Vibrio chagasii]